MNKKTIKYINRICELVSCGKIFVVNINLARELKKRFCSHNCSSIYNGLRNKGKKRSKKVRKLMSIINTGKRNGFWNKRHSNKSKKMMSKSNLFDESKYKYYNLTEYEKKFIDGFLLGDGNIAIPTRISSRLTFGFKYKQMSDFIIKNIPSLKFSKLFKYEDHGNYYWYGKSKCYYNLVLEYNRWYKNRKKIVPKDIRINNHSCYCWYLGDGYIFRKRAYLCTDAFTIKENKYLMKKLKYYGFNVKLTSKNRICFDKDSSIKFLKWIRPKKEILKIYKYKWKI